ncbi:hypothetical protein NX059_010097 [Plenodomus lindquistii]|nr:hypothetical protein NX059_010097 [Plenodomus lindquistii]
MPNQLDTTGLTHLILAFANIDPKSFKIGLMNPDDEAIYSQFLALPGGLRKIIGLGGWEFSDPGVTRFTWSDMTSTKEHRHVFIDSLQQFLSTWKFTGVDIDWEWPGASDRGGNSADKENLVALVSELRQAMGPNFLISVNLPAQYDYLKGMDLIRLEAQVDWLNMLTYNLHGPWDANLSGLGPYMKPHTDLKDIDKVLDLLWSAGVTPKNVVMALANYGRGYTVENKECAWYGCKFTGPSRPGVCTKENGILSTCEIRRIISQHNLTPKLIDGGAGVKEIAWDDQWVNYDDPETFDLKLKLANDRCLGGTALWAIDYAVCGNDGASPQPGSSVVPTPPVATGITSKPSVGLPAPSSQTLIAVPSPSSHPPSQQSPGASSNAPSTSTTGSTAAPFPPAQSSWSTAKSSAGSNTPGSSTEGSNIPGSSAAGSSAIVITSASVIGSLTDSAAASSSPPSSWPGPSSADSTASASIISWSPLPTSSVQGEPTGIPVVVPVPMPSGSPGVTSSYQAGSSGATTVAPTASSHLGSTVQGSSIFASVGTPSGAPASSSVFASPSGAESFISGSWPGTSVIVAPTASHSDSQSSRFLPTGSTAMSSSDIMLPTQSTAIASGSAVKPSQSTVDGEFPTAPSNSATSTVPAWSNIASSVGWTTVSSSTGGVVIIPIPIPVHTSNSQTTSGSNFATWSTDSNADTWSMDGGWTSTTVTTSEGTTWIVPGSTTEATSDGAITTTGVNTDFPTLPNATPTPVIPSSPPVVPTPIILPPPSSSSTPFGFLPITTSPPGATPGVPTTPSVTPGQPTPTPTQVDPDPPIPTDVILPILVPALDWDSDSHSDSDPECVPNDCIQTCISWRLISFLAFKRPICPCIPHTCDKKTNNKKKKCKLFGCGCGWMGLAFGPGCPGPDFDITGIIPPGGLFGENPCRFFGCPGNTPGLIGSNGFCYGPGCDTCPPEICSGHGPSPGPNPTQPSGKPKECAEKDKTRVTERFVYCTENFNVSVSAIPTSILGTASTMISTVCVPLIEATMKVCPGLMDGYTTTTTTTLANTVTSTSSDAPACTRAPLSLDDDEGSNDDPLSSSIRYSSNTTRIASSTIFSNSTYLASSTAFSSSLWPSSSSGQSSSLSQSSSLAKSSSKSAEPSSSTRPSSSSVKPSSSSVKPSSSSVKPSTTSKKPTPSPSKAPMDRNGSWKAKVLVRMEHQRADLGWTLYDPNGYEAGQGWNSAQGSEIRARIESQHRPMEESARYAVTMLGKDLLDVDKARVTFILEQPLEKCTFADGNACRPSMTTENRPETEMFEVNSCEFYCMDRKDVKLLQADLWCDDLNQAMWMPKNAGFERVFWCGWKGY